MPGIYIYEAGPAASKCKTGTNPDFPQLCSVDEDYTEDLKKRTAWGFPPEVKNGQYNLPLGCEDDPTGECQEIKADPNKYFKKFSKPQDTKPKITTLSNGQVSFEFPPGCDDACQNKAVQDYMATHSG